MIKLAFIACLMTSPTDCNNYSLQFVDVSLSQCMMYGQIELAKWNEQRPDMIVTEYTCKPIDQSEQNI